MKSFLGFVLFGMGILMKKMTWLWWWRVIFWWWSRGGGGGGVFGGGECLGRNGE